ncbi:hypothetical protein K2173_003184 [Erythroxylum novogranatense]|uniref:Single-stranded DNA binding protein Ssb-like OB fold domain-containing protein n=1 Tax=Erythroxylum novogranatense TaxID=1862640 RepID=A0AAV8SWV2_9ROSI|nr:hypothetical protein K2173_003184 [Erythroxylum novogranatense]
MLAWIGEDEGRSSTVGPVTSIIGDEEENEGERERRWCFTSSRNERQGTLSIQEAQSRVDLFTINLSLLEATLTKSLSLALSLCYLDSQLSFQKKMADSKSGLRKPVFTKVDQLRPGTSGHTLTVKVVSTKMVLQKGRADGPQIRQMRIAECLVGDETGMIIFTARNDQGDVCYPYFTGILSFYHHIMISFVGLELIALLCFGRINMMYIYQIIMLINLNLKSPRIYEIKLVVCYMV